MATLEIKARDVTGTFGNAQHMYFVYTVISPFALVWFILEMLSVHNGRYPSYKDVRSNFERSGADDSRVEFDRLVGYSIERVNESSTRDIDVMTAYVVYKLKDDMYKLLPEDIGKPDARLYLFARKGQEIVYHRVVKRISSRYKGNYRSGAIPLDDGIGILPGYEPLRVATWGEAYLRSFFKESVDPMFDEAFRKEKLLVFDSGEYAPHVMPPFVRDSIFRQAYNSLTGLYDQ
jgi:hypothetical protein